MPGYEIDFLPVGAGEKSGDAIALRYGSPGAYRTVIVDGGNEDSGKALVAHVRWRYQTNTIDALVGTHPHEDHSSGLRVVLEQLAVREVWIHRPWEYTEHLLPLFKDPRLTAGGLRQRLRSEYVISVELEEMAIAKGAALRTPFQGEWIGDLQVQSPTFNMYLRLIALSDRTPECAPGLELETPVVAASRLRQFAKAVAQWIRERWDQETLSEDRQTTPENETSVVLFGSVDGRSFLLCGDAGKHALNTACDHLEQTYGQVPSLSFVQVPHHGSRNNVAPSVLDRLLGVPVVEGTKPFRTAFVSASKNDTEHPRRVVSNAFTRRGCFVCVTNGIVIWHYYSMPARDDYSPLEPLPFYDRVETDES